MSEETRLREAICEHGRLLFGRGFSVGSAGNISVRLPDGFLITPTNSSLGSLDPARISKVDRHWRHVAGDPPSKELFLHAAYYESRPGTGAVVHLHSTYATALSCLDDVDETDCVPPLTPYVVMRVGRVRRVPYVKPGDPKAGDLVRATRLRTLVPILRTTLFIAIALVVLLTALNELGINIAPLLAGASIIGVAIGFGSQKLVQDFITGIFLLMENAMQVGDSVTLAGVSGTVENLSIRTVRLRAGDGSLHVVPFSSVGTVTNNHRGIGNASIRVSVTADSNLDEVIAAIRNVGEQMRNDPQLGPLMLGGLELWGVDQVDGASITLAGQIRAIDRGRWAVQRGFNERISRRFRQLGIQMANPQARFLPEKEEAGKAPAAPAGRDDAGPSS